MILGGGEVDDGCVPCWVGRRLRCLEKESWTTAVLLGWKTAALLSG